MPAPKDRYSPLEPRREKPEVPPKKKIKAAAVIKSCAVPSRSGGINLRRLWKDEPNRPSFFVNKAVSRQHLPDSFHKNREETLKKNGST